MQSAILGQHGPKMVVLLHAYAGGPNDMRLVARALELADYSVYVPLFRGHGADPRQILEQGSPERWWQDTQNAIRYVKELGYTEISVFGLSLGGIFAAQALLTEPLVRCGGAFASPLLGTGDLSAIQADFSVLSQQYYARSGAEKTQITADLKWLEEQVPIQLRTIQQYTAANVAQWLPFLRKPLFIGQGTADVLTSPADASRLVSQLENAHVPVSMHWFINAGHVLTTNQAHSELIKAVQQFLQKTMI